MVERIDYGAALRRSWRLFLALAVIGFVVAILLPVSKPAPNPSHKYHWSSSVIVGTEPSDGIGGAGVNGQTVLFWAESYYTKAAACLAAGVDNQFATLAPLMTSTQTTFAALGAKSKSSKAATKTARNSNIVELTSVQTTQALSAKLTNAYAVQVGDAVNKAFKAHQQSAAKQSAGAAASSGYFILQPALASDATRLTFGSSGVSSSRKVRGLAGIVVGILLAAIIVLVREFTDRTLRSAHGAESATHYPVLGEVPESAPLSGEGQHAVGLAVAEDPRSPSAEGYRMLRMSVMFEELAVSQPPADPFGIGPSPWEATTNGKYSKPEPGSRKVVLVVSPERETTRPIVAANLGATYAEAGQRAIVISTDDLDSGYPMVRPVEHPHPLRPNDVAAFLQTSSLPNVSRLSFRHFVSTSGQLVTRAPEVLDAARQLADVVIVESPPFLESHHGEALVHAVDVVLVVVQSRSTTIVAGKRTGDLLRRIGAPVLGVVLTNVGGSRAQTQRMTKPVAPESGAAVPVANESQILPEATKS
jgi:Mrp family chromosome partitioning ATPase